jgi:hypothetical protein
VPALIVVPPEYVFTPDSVSVPAPIFTSDAPEPPNKPPSSIVPLTVVERLLPPTVSWLEPSSYAPAPSNSIAAMVLCFAFGVGNAVHMLAFSTAADVVTPNRIGTSAAIVNGIMFLVGGIMISRPGVRIGLGIEAGIEPKSLELAQYAARPLMVAIVGALAIALVMRETFPKRGASAR